MSENKMKEFNSTQDYSIYIETLKSIVKQNQIDRKNVDQLQCVAKYEESKLQNHLHHLHHLQEIQQAEQQMWQARSQELSNKQRQLEKTIEQQSKNLALCRAELEHGLRMIDLMPNSQAKDYLAHTSLHKSPSESIHGDWVKVGDQLAHSYFINKATKK